MEARRQQKHEQTPVLDTYGKVVEPGPIRGVASLNRAATAIGHLHRIDILIMEGCVLEAMESLRYKGSEYQVSRLERGYSNPLDRRELNR